MRNTYRLDPLQTMLRHLVRARASGRAACLPDNYPAHPALLRIEEALLIIDAEIDALQRGLPPLYHRVEPQPLTPVYSMALARAQLELLASLIEVELCTRAPDAGRARLLKDVLRVVEVAYPLEEGR